MTRTTIVYTPHPDDETLRLNGYVTTCAANGDRLILVAVTDGGATGLAGDWGWTPQMMEDMRIVEQEHAWAASTAGRGTIIRLGLPDGGVPGNEAVITAKVQALDAEYGPDVEHYCACFDTDYHPDHQAVVRAVRAAGVRIVRTSQVPGQPTQGTLYQPADFIAARLASNSYRAIGWESVPDEFTAVANQGYTSDVTG